MGTGLDSLTTTAKMDRKIPAALWKTELLKLVGEAPRAACVSYCSGDEWSRSRSSPDDDMGPRPLMSSSSGSTTSTASSADNFLQRLLLPNHGENSSDEKLNMTTSLLRPVPGEIQFEAYSRLNNGSDSDGTRTETATNHVQNQNSTWDHHRSLMDFSSEDNPFGKAFHGYLTQAQTSKLLQKDGQFLVRKKDPSDEDFILSFRCCGLLKNFILSWDDSTGFLYVGDKEKSYATLQELVQEGLITLYLDQKARSYIDLMFDLTKFHKVSTPPVPLPTTPLLGARVTNGAIVGVPSSPNLSRSNNPNSVYSNGSSGRVRKNSASPSPTQTSSLSKSSVERRKKLDLKSHSFQIHTFQGLSTCQICQNFLWGLSCQGLQCVDCKFNVHESCLERVHCECEPRLESLSRIFGEDLTLLVKAAKGHPPFVLVKCITEIEKRGMAVEGIYRVSGSKELIERLKTFLEKERKLADLSHHLDIHSICCVVKLFLRHLPQPLVTAEVFQKFLTAKGPLTTETLRRCLRKLPLSHQVTLKYLLQHLYRVSQNSDQNRMTPFNLSSVFTPSIICSTEISLNTVKMGTTVLEALIKNVPALYPLTEEASRR